MVVLKDSATLDSSSIMFPNLMGSLACVWDKWVGAVVFVGKSSLDELVASSLKSAGDPLNKRRALSLVRFATWEFVKEFIVGGRRSWR